MKPGDVFLSCFCFGFKFTSIFKTWLQSKGLHLSLCSVFRDLKFHVAPHLLLSKSINYIETKVVRLSICRTLYSPNGAAPLASFPITLFCFLCGRRTALPERRCDCFVSCFTRRCSQSEASPWFSNYFGS